MRKAVIQLHENIMHEPNVRTATGRSSDCGGFFQIFHGFKDFFHMAWNLQAAPFLFQSAICTHQKGAAFDAFDFFTVHDLVFNDTEHVAHFFFGIGDQLKR